MNRAVPAVLLALLLVAAGAHAAEVGPFEDPPEPTPHVNTLEITDRGCRGDLRPFARSQTGPNGLHVESGILQTDSPAAELTASAIRISPENAEIVSYRVDVRTHEPSNATASCAGEIAYRLNVTAPGGSTGSRVAVYIDGDIVSCGGGTSGGDIGCGRLLQADDRPYAASTNRTLTGNGPADSS